MTATEQPTTITKGQDMHEKTITITNLNEVQDGDICTVEIRGLQYTGPVYNGEYNTLKWGGRILRYSKNMSSTYITFISATRTTPSLPTEIGSVIFIHEALGRVCDPPVQAIHDGDTVHPWILGRTICGTFGLDEDDITRWQKATVIPEGEVIPND